MISNEQCWMKSRCNHVDCKSPFCLRLYKTNFLYDKALIPLNLREHKRLMIDRDGTDEQEFSILKSIELDIENFISTGKNLYISSAICGNGKTSWALRLVEAFIDKIWYSSKLECRVLFISVSKFLLSLKDNISNQNSYIQYIKENVDTCDLVIWDDIGTKSATTFEHEHLLSIIDSRLSNGKSNIFTSNLNNNNVREVLGDRLASRILNTSINVELHGADKRCLTINK